MAQLVSEWRSEGVTSPEQNLIVANQNEDVRELNRAAQLERFLGGELSETFIVIAGQTCRCRDRVLFTKNSRLFGVDNGALGTISNLEGTRLTVALDTGGSTSFALADYDHLRLGYAVTTHKAQGMTAENVFVLAGDAMQDREISYVQASRARGLTRLYLNREAAGEELQDAVRQMSVSHQKMLAQELLEEPERFRSTDGALAR